MLRTPYVKGVRLIRQTDKFFPDSVRDLVLENPALTRKNGSPNWMKVARLATVHYETLRKALSKEREPGDGLMEALADALGVRADYFVEYRLRRVRDGFDPEKVGLETALANIARWREIAAAREVEDAAAPTA